MVVVVRYDVSIKAKKKKRKDGGDWFIRDFWSGMGSMHDEIFVMFYGGKGRAHHKSFWWRLDETQKNPEELIKATWEQISGWLEM